MMGLSPKWVYYKERSFASNYTLLFWKFCFNLRTLIKNWFDVPNAYIRTFCKRWSFIWRCLFAVSILISCLQHLAHTLSNRTYHIPLIVTTRRRKLSFFPRLFLFIYVFPTFYIFFISGNFIYATDVLNKLYYSYIVS